MFAAKPDVDILKLFLCVCGQTWRRLPQTVSSLRPNLVQTLLNFFYVCGQTWCGHFQTVSMFVAKPCVDILKPFQSFQPNLVLTFSNFSSKYIKVKDILLTLSDYGKYADSPLFYCYQYALISQNISWYPF